jgi:hypothetical protein
VGVGGLGYTEKGKCLKDILNKLNITLNPRMGFYLNDRRTESRIRCENFGNKMFKLRLFLERKWKLIFYVLHGKISTLMF